MRAMKVLFPIMLVFLLGSALSLCAQETSIDLRRDGRIISGTRKDFLVQRALSYSHSIKSNTPPSNLAAKMSDRLRNKLLSSDVAAIVVPDRKTGERFIVGLLIGKETLPEDCVVDEADFNLLRDYSINKKLASVEKAFNEIEKARTRLQITSEISAIKAMISNIGLEQGWIRLYAGFLLAELDGMPEMPQPDELVTGYRTEFERSVSPSIQTDLKGQKYGSYEWFEVTKTKNMVSYSDLSRARISMQPSTQESVAYLKIWHGRSLLIGSIPRNAKAQAAAYRDALAKVEAEVSAARTRIEEAVSKADKAREELARVEAEQAKQDKAALQNKLFISLSEILETRREARGLIVNLSDVLFDFNKATLKPGAREKLSKLAGIMLAYPGAYRIEIEGHTDGVGSQDYNQKLSEDRAGTVHAYLVKEGIATDRIIAVRGFSKVRPVATNDTPEGRQQERRVQIVISDTDKTSNQ